MNEFETTAELIEPHGGFFPWRRYFARTLDLSILSSIVAMVISWGLDMSLIDFSEMQIYLIITIPAIILMLVIEPFLISKFATTPAKALLGISVYDDNGNKLSYGEAFSRTMGALFIGFGFGVGLISTITCIVAYRRLKRYQPMSYDDGISIVVKKVAVFRYLSFVAIEVALVFLLAFVTLTDFLPTNRGELTKSEYIENFNHFVDVYSIEDVTMDADGVLMVEDFFTKWEMDFEFTEENGVLTSVSFYHDEKEPSIQSDITLYMELATIAFDSNAELIDAIDRSFLEQFRVSTTIGTHMFSERDMQIEYKIENEEDFSASFYISRIY